MTTRHWLYPLPDDNYVSMTAVLDSLPPETLNDVDWAFDRSYLVVITDPIAALYLSLKFEEGRLSDLDGNPLLAMNEVVVQEDDRLEFEATLVLNCPSEATWFALVRVVTTSDEAHEAFRASHMAVTGLVPTR